MMLSKNLLLLIIIIKVVCATMSFLPLSSTGSQPLVLNIHSS